MRTPILLMSLGLSGLSGLMGCGGGEDAQTGQTGGGGNTVVPQKGFETPEAAFQAFQAAAKADDFGTMVSTMTVESQQAIAGSLVFALSMVAAFDQEKGAEVTKLLERHGISEDERDGPPPGADPNAGPGGMMRTIGSMTNDPAAFIAEAMKWMGESPGNSTDKTMGVGTLGEITIEGDSASATLTDDDDVKPIEFRKVSSGWLVHIPEEEFGMGGAAGEDSDFAGFDDFDFHFDEEDELPPPDAVTREAFDAAWQTSVDYNDRPAGQILAELAVESGLNIFDQPDFAEKLQQSATVKLENASRLQVIEAVCEQVGLYPRYKLKTMAFAEGPRPFPIAFAGPFLIAVHEVVEHAPYPAGRLELMFFAAGIPTASASQITSLSQITDDESGDQFTLKVASITGNGQDLQGSDMGGYMRQGSLATVMFSRGFQLRNLLKAVESIDPIEGSISWPFPTEIKTLTFNKLEENAVAEDGDLRLKLSKADAGDNPHFRVDVEGVDYQNVTLIGRDGSGNAIENNFRSSSSFGNKQIVEVMLEGKPATLDARVVVASDRMSYSFQIAAIPLTSHEQMPKALTELSVDGDQPVTIELEKIGGDEHFKKLFATATNHTNKAIHSIQMKLEYLGADGKVVKDWQASEQGDRVLIELGEQASLEITAFFMPEEATSARIIATEIEFADATEWSAPE